MLLYIQVRIKIECCFGMLVQRFGVLRKPIQSSISLQKSTALVISLCSLHNFCIRERLQRKESTIITDDACAEDYANMLANGCVPLEVAGHADRVATTVGVPRQLLDGGEHFDGTTSTMRRHMLRLSTRGLHHVSLILPREKMHAVVVEKGLKRPTPIRWVR